MKVKRNNDFDKSLLAYTGKSRKPFKKINRQWGTMKSLCSFSKDRVFTLFTEWRRVLSLGRVGDKSSWAEEKFWMSRGWVLDEPGMSLGRAGDEFWWATGESREESKGAMTVLFLLHDVWMMKRERGSDLWRRLGEKEDDYGTIIDRYCLFQMDIQTLTATWMSISSKKWARKN